MGYKLAGFDVVGCNEIDKRMADLYCRNLISAGTVDYTDGEEVRANLLKGRSSAKSEAHESLAHG